MVPIASHLLLIKCSEINIKYSSGYSWEHIADLVQKHLNGMNLNSGTLGTAAQALIMMGVSEIILSTSSHLYPWRIESRL